MRTENPVPERLPCEGVSVEVPAVGDGVEGNGVSAQPAAENLKLYPSVGKLRATWVYHGVILIPCFLLMEILATVLGDPVAALMLALMFFMMAALAAPEILLTFKVWRDRQIPVLVFRDDRLCHHEPGASCGDKVIFHQDMTRIRFDSDPDCLLVQTRQDLTFRLRVDSLEISTKELADVLVQRIPNLQKTFGWDWTDLRFNPPRHRPDTLS